MKQFIYNFYKKNSILCQNLEEINISALYIYICMNALLSYPRSGNHLARFFIELLSETPTLGDIRNIYDVPICRNVFPKPIPFNIIDSIEENESIMYRKCHHVPDRDVKKLLFIVRNPREVLLRHLDYNFRLNGWDGYESYFDSIDYFNNFEGEKHIFFYEDIYKDKIAFVKELYAFLHIQNESKLQYVLENIDELFELSKKGEGRSWGGVNSTSDNFYYNKLSGDAKIQFDNYIQTKLLTNKYTVLKTKYNL